MSLDQELLQGILQNIDRMIGKQYTDLKIEASPDRTRVRLTATCRGCKRLEHAEGKVGEPGWAKEMIDDLLWNCDQHFKTHSRSALVLPPSYQQPRGN